MNNYPASSQFETEPCISNHATDNHNMKNCGCTMFTTDYILATTSTVFIQAAQNVTEKDTTPPNPPDRIV